jgi:hypothetical protein
MDKVAACCDLIAGFLVAIDIAAPSSGQAVGKWLIKRLPELNETVDLSNVKTFRLSLLFIIPTLAILTFFAIFKDMRAGTTSLWPTVGLFFIGMVIGVIFIFVLSRVISKLRRIYNCRHGTTTTSSQDDTLLLGVIVLIWFFGVLAFLLLRFATGTRTFLAAPILTFVFTCWVLPAAVLWNRYFVKHHVTPTLEKPCYALARIGLLIFAISKLIYIIL